MSKKNKENITHKRGQPLLRHETQIAKKDQQKKHLLRMVSKSYWGAQTCLKAPIAPLFLIWIKTNNVWFAWKIPNWSMYRLLVNINQDLKKRWNKDNNSTVYSSEYWSKIIPIVRCRWAQPQPKHQALTLSSLNKLYLDLYVLGDDALIS